jgi:hypothetical protein
MRSLVLLACAIALFGVCWTGAQAEAEEESLIVRHHARQPRVAHHPIRPPTSNRTDPTDCSFNGVGGLCQAAGSCAGTSVPGECRGEQICCIVQGQYQPGCGTAAVNRAMNWVRMQLLYCQSPNGQPDGDQDCSAICNRLSNPKWDAYRSDCSAFVSFAYGIPPPGRVTWEFAPSKTDLSFNITAQELQPGDALNSVPDEHIMLFKQWLNEERTAVQLMEEPGCAMDMPYARITETTLNYTSDGLMYLDCNGMAFQPIRLRTNSPPC